MSSVARGQRGEESTKVLLISYGPTSWGINAEPAAGPGPDFGGHASCICARRLLQKTVVVTKRKGFTFIELTIAMAIIGVLAAITLPRLNRIQERALVATMKSDLRTLVNAEEYYLVENQRYSTNLAGSYDVSADNQKPTITLTPDGWSASIRSYRTTVTCAVFVGSTPLLPASKESTPACF
jgi:prepilin-type N-terminal cleavage/methylation domain-containing protein